MRCTFSTPQGVKTGSAFGIPEFNRPAGDEVFRVSRGDSMTKNTSDKVNDPRIIYADIIDLPHWQSPTRPHMSLNDRSAQFASYKSLRGYEDMVGEEARQTEKELQLGERELQRLNQKLTLLSDVLDDGEHPKLTFTVFVPDARKSGGKYIPQREPAYYGAAGKRDGCAQGYI